MWASIVASVLGFLGAGIKLALQISQNARDKLLVSLGSSKQSNADLQGRIDALKEANRLRNEAESRVNRDDAGGVPVDDGFERKGDD